MHETAPSKSRDETKSRTKTVLRGLNGQHVITKTNGFSWMSRVLKWFVNAAKKLSLHHHKHDEYIRYRGSLDERCRLLAERVKTVPGDHEREVGKRLVDAFEKGLLGGNCDVEEEKRRG